MAEALFVFTSLADAEQAHRLATALVEAKLAACVSVLPPCTSIYRWQGKVETANEVVLLIKTSAPRYEALQAAILAQHPYELPEIAAVPVVRGLPAYVRWIDAESST